MIRKEISAIALILVTALSVFIAVQPLQSQSNAEHFSELGILRPQQKIANYPSNLTIGQMFLIYGYHEGVAEYYTVYVKLGNLSTAISNTTSANAPVISSYSYVLNNGQNATFPMNLSVGQSGTKLRMIFELWSFDKTYSSFVYTGLYADLRVNVTST